MITTASRWQDAAISGAPPPPGSRTFGCVVVADHGAVEIAEAVDLRGAEEADVDAAALQPVGEDLRHARPRRRRSRPARRRRSRAAGCAAWRRSSRSRRSARSRARGSRRARFAAAAGRPMPTKQTAPSRSRRAAATAIISSACSWRSSPRRALGRRDARARASTRERLAVAADRVPRAVERVVALVVAVRVGRLRAAGRDRTTASTTQRRDDHAAGTRPSSSTISSTVTSDRADGEHRLLLHADDPPELHVAVRGRPAGRGRCRRRAAAPAPPPAARR